MAFRTTIPLVIASITMCVATLASAEETVRFNRDIRPILSNKCYACHGPDANKREADLKLFDREDVLRKRDWYAVIVPGDSANSELAYRITAEDEDERMPPADYGKTLTDQEIDLLIRWIDQGAEYESHWSFIPPKRHKPPAINSDTWSANPIDRFILRKLQEKGLEPSPDADPVTLVRRLSFDLTGLPPDPERVDAFTQNPSAKAYEQLVDELLASPRYGERMALFWLDLVRYADTAGYHSDEFWSVWPYRDYVIDAFNDNMPFDEFTIEQLAGDLLPNRGERELIASGYNRLNQITSEGGAQPGEYIVKYAADRVRTTSSVWLGITMACAQCHDHKFDSITSKDFYSFSAFFADIKERGKYSHGNDGFAPYLELPTPDQEAELKRLKEELQLLESGDVISSDIRAKTKLVEEQIKQLKSEIPTTLITESVKPKEIRVLPRGNWMDTSGEVVGPAVPEVLPDMEVDGDRPTRLDLAHWIVDPENPLTARTFVNRLWKQYFGTGISKVLDDLGAQGEWPTHPELLDWLAVEFIDSGWDIKHMVRLMVTSHTYRQSSLQSARLKEIDPNNRLYARQSRFRLPAELIRDNVLAVSGLLNGTIGGPSVRPYQPEGYYSDTYAGVGKLVQYEADTGPAQYRRGLYVIWKRTFLHPSMLAFDAPTREECTAERPISNTPTQALVLLNDPTYVEAARAFGERILTEGGETFADRLTFAFRESLSRSPSVEELETLEKLYDKHLAEYRDDRDAVERVVQVGQHAMSQQVDNTELAAWTSVARVIFNLHETITRS